jgi:class 3 adenylate cyclase
VDDRIPDQPRDIEPDAEQTEAAYRGFLFADLRGYTAFVERHGDAAAADLLDAYRSLVRDEVARHAGAEIRTEGDSFYVVFQSARRAVICGLAIVRAAERFRHDHPEQPIRVGIGINAGETVQRGEGFVGTAVNLAARVCAQAREGEVLVTSAVRDAIGAGAGRRFASRGTRRLKGIARPVPLFAVEQEAAPAHRTLAPSLATIPWLPLGVVAAGGVVTAVAIVLLGGWLESRPPSGAATSPAAVTLTSPSTSSSASASALPDPDAYPNAAEAELLAKLDESVAVHCRRADDDERPVYRIDPLEAADQGVPSRLPVSVDAGVRCEIPSIAAPDTFHLWVTRSTYRIAGVELPAALILNKAGALVRGDCSSQVSAYDRWALGDAGGWLLCREDHGDAVIEWSYDDRSIYGIAVRRDGDLSALLRWWSAEARLLRP